MTRNNLNEHLSWLLNTRASIPTASTGHIVQQASPTVTARVDRSALHSLSRSNITRSTTSPEESVITSLANEADRATMPRVRICPGSENKAFKTNVVQSPPASPSKPPRSIPPLQGAGVPRDEAKSKLSGAVKHEGTPKTQNDMSKVEIMDLTGCSNDADTPEARRFDTVPVAGRKRKSEEFERDHKTFARSVVQADATGSRSPEGFATIDEMIDESPVRKPTRSSNEPPPLASTIPFKLTSTENGARLQTPVEDLTSAKHKANRTPSPLMTDKHDDDDDIVHFSARSSRKRPAAFRSPSVERPILPRSGSGGNQMVSTNSILPPTQSSNAGLSEESALLKKIFTASDSRLENLLRDLEAELERVSDKAAEMIDEDCEDPEIFAQLDDISQRRDAVSQLCTQRKLYLQLVTNKDRLMSDLKQALKSRSGVDEAKAANAAAKSELQSVESECLPVLASCRGDVEKAMQGPTPTSSADSSMPHQIAIRSTQQPDRRVEQEEMIPSSSRIAQTQTWSAMPPPQTIQRTHEQKDTTANARTQSNKTLSHKMTNSVVRNNDGFPFPDDELYELDMIDAQDDLFSHRMGTPPVPYDNNDDDFGMDDDDDLWAAAQNVGHSTSAVSRSRVINNNDNNLDTYGTRPTKLNSAQKAKKTTDKVSGDLERQNFSFPWSDEVKRALKERFKLKGFRASQVEAINATLAGKDVFVLMPTGGGKSLCYQLPSLVRSGKTRGVTIVVSPLVSLMEDQVTHLQNLGIQAFLINGDTPVDQRSAIMEKFSDPGVERFVQLLYVTPEMLGKSQRMLDAFGVLHRNGRLARIVIDEAHCVSQWGHDFRPDYKQLGSVRQKFPGVPVMALTATATENVRIDTIHNLGMKGCEVFSRSFNRSNLYYEVRSKGTAKGDMSDIASLIKDTYRKQTGIVYCLSRKNCETFAKDLKDQGISAHHYHAGLEPAVKSQILKDWQAGKHQVVVATIAFGMGIDKANVRFVIHYSMPKSLEGYYQETGRAGRDGLLSGCYLFYAYRDVAMLRKMIDQNADASWEQKNRQRQMLARMEQFCSNETDCRRVQVLNYFNEAFERDDCKGQCDNCKSDASFDTVDFTRYAQQAVSLVTRLTSDSTNHITVNQLIDVFRGGKKVKEEWMEYDEYGAGADLDRGIAERIFHRLLSEDVLREDHVLKGGFPHQYVAIGRSRDLYGGSRKFEIQIRETVRSKVAKIAGKARAKKSSEQDTATRPANSSRARELPMSTNVSSPIQAASGRSRAAKQMQSYATTNHGYQRDGFVMSDAETDSDDAFEPVREAGSSKKPLARELGPPITSDAALAKLDHIHRSLVDSFVVEAEPKCKEIMNKKSLRYQPFTNTMLREMAIRWTDTEAKMLTIRGIDPEKVKLFGKPFQEMVARHYRAYEDMNQSFENGDEPEPEWVDKHAQNVIDLVSDDEEGEDSDEEFGSVPSDLEDDGEQSSYFQTAPEVAAFNARLSQAQSLAAKTMAASQTQNKSSPKRRKKSSHYAVKARKTKASTSSLSGFRFNGESAPTTSKRAPRRRLPNGGTTTAAPSRRGSTASRGRGRGRSTFSMMPT